MVYKINKFLNNKKIHFFKKNFKKNLGSNFSFGDLGINFLNVYDIFMNLSYMQI